MNEETSEALSERDYTLPWWRAVVAATYNAIGASGPEDEDDEDEVEVPLVEKLGDTPAVPNSHPTSCCCRECTGEYS